MTELNHRARDWLPEVAAQYAAGLTGLKGEDRIHTFSSSSVGEVTFKNELSKRLLLDLRMEEVWRHLSKVCEINDRYVFSEFLAEVQFAANGPGLISARSPQEKLDDLDDLGKAFKQIARISKRYGIDVSQIPVGHYFNIPSLESLLDETDNTYAVRGGNDVTFKEYFDELKNLISRQQMLIKKPEHKNAPYQYFVRRVYLYFKKVTPQPNKWKILSIIASVSLQENITPNKVRGTCQDLK